jgi:ribosomal protein L31
MLFISWRIDAVSDLHTLYEGKQRFYERRNRQNE